jgi:transglutaminase-like putative cysteine protease
MLSALRGLGLAARYVSGYLRSRPPPGEAQLVGADASHAWVEVWCPLHSWVEFDPTNDRQPAADYVRLATGRDFADVSPLRGVIRGGGEHTLNVAVRVSAVEA